MYLKRMLTMVMVVMALGAFTLVATAPVAMAGKKKVEQEAIKKSTKKMIKKTPTVKKTLLKEKININKATKEELMALPGIGPAKADEIIKARKKTKFKTLDDVLNVSGIGEQTVEKIKPFLKFK